MKEFISLLAFLSFFVTSGIVDGVLWSKTGAGAFRNNEHIYLWLQRFSVFVLAVVNVPIIWAVLVCMLFPAIHNGVYYETQKHISKGIVYPDGWQSEPSDTSTAYINFSFKLRMGLAAVAVILIVTYITL